GGRSAFGREPRTAVAGGPRREAGTAVGRSKWADKQGSVFENRIASPRRDCGHRNALSEVVVTSASQLTNALMKIIGEFDPGSERTLAACLTHASRGRKPARVSKPANGCVTRG